MYKSLLPGFSGVKNVRTFPVLFLCFLVLHFTVAGQQIDWASYDTAVYTFNPAFTSVPAAKGPQEELVCSWLGAFSVSYNQKLYGTQVVRTFSPSGNSYINHLFGPKAEIRSLHRLPDGGLIVSGSFMDTLYADGTPLFPVNTPFPYDRNVFLVCFSDSGTVQWSRNISSTYPGMEELDADAIDPNGKYWFASMAWGLQQSVAVCINDAGQDSVVHPLPAVQALLSDMAFDPSGALYLCGGIGTGSFQFGGIPVTITAPYNRFLAKMDAQGQGRWFRTIGDITFQKHRISITDDAEIYFTGALFDSVTVAGFHLDGPNWVYDHLTVKFDSTGAVVWAHDVPNGASITGDLQLAAGQSIAADDSGYYQLVRFRGTLDIGNNQQIGFGGPTVSYGFSLIRYDRQGVPQWHTDVPTVYGIYPFTVLATSFGGYLIGTASGSQQIGPVNITMPTSGTFFSWAARFSRSGASGINSTFASPVLAVYPNPSSDGRLRITGSKSEGQLHIHDLQGRLLVDRIVASDHSDVDTALPSGVYLVTVGDGPPLRWTVIR